MLAWYSLYKSLLQLLFALLWYTWNHFLWPRSLFTILWPAWTSSWSQRPKGGLPSLHSTSGPSGHSSRQGHGRGGRGTCATGFSQAPAGSQETRPGHSVEVSFIRPGLPSWRWIGVGRGLPFPPCDKPRYTSSAPAWQLVTAFSQAGRPPVTPALSNGAGRFWFGDNYQRRRQRRRREREQNGTLVGIDSLICINDAYRSPFSDIEAIGEELENRRQMFYNNQRPSCAFYVLAKEAYCVLHGFTNHPGDLPWTLSLCIIRYISIAC